MDKRLTDIVKNAEANKPANVADLFGSAMKDRVVAACREMKKTISKSVFGESASKDDDCPAYEDQGYEDAKEGKPRKQSMFTATTPEQRAYVKGYNAGSKSKSN